MSEPYFKWPKREPQFRKRPAADVARMQEKRKRRSTDETADSQDRAAPVSPDPWRRIIEALEENGYAVRQRDDASEQWSAQCPAHEDRRRSLEVGEDSEGNAGVSCLAGCRTEDVLAAIGLTMSALYRDGYNGREARRDHSRHEALTNRAHEQLMADQALLHALMADEGWTIEALCALRIGRADQPEFNDRLPIGVDWRWIVWPERRASGTIVAHRLYLPKCFRTGREGTTKLLLPVPRDGGPGMIFEPEAVSSMSERPALVVEGGACAIAARSLGYPVVAYSSAAQLPKQAWAKIVRGCELYVLPDAGAEAAGEKVGTIFLKSADSVSIVSLPEAGVDDLADLLRDRGRDEASTVLQESLAQPETVLVKPKRGRKPESLEEARAFLREVLGDGEWHCSAEVEAGARSRGISTRTLDRAREGLVETDQKGRKHLMRLANPFHRRRARKGYTHLPST